ncbi:MAG TPA: hypothetical protein VGP88_07195 [Thermoplasmata archaeon]|nr:hypothetical protein [Thermoplasmata archaeon]
MSRMPSLFARCGECETGFPSGIAVTSESALKEITMNGLHHRCPKCGADGTYFTKDYYVPSGIEKVASAPPDQTTPSGAAAQEESVKLSGYGVGAR